MSALTFKAVIAGVHFDPKKGIVKIPLESTSYVSMDKLIALGPIDESVTITLESAQTKISDVGDPIAIDEKGAAWREEAARKLEESEEPEEPKEVERILMKTPPLGASGEEEE